MSNGTHVGVGLPARPGPTAEGVLGQLARILASREFRGARSRARFLEYVVQRTLAGQVDGLKEYTIGVEVFERGTQFDPKADGVVRTQAGLVRRHLELYYAGEGSDDPVVIMIPKGHYIPEFRARPEASAHDASPVGRGAGTTSRWARWAVLGGCTAAAAVLIAVGLARGRQAAVAAPTGSLPPGAATSGDAVCLPLWRNFLEPGATNVLAFGTPQFFTAAGVWVRDVDMNTPTDADSHGYVRSLRERAGTDLVAAEAYTGIGEAFGVYHLSRFFLERSRELRVVRSRAVSWDNVRQDNVIFLASARFRTLADQLAYPSDFVHVLGPVNRVQNLRPAANEQAWYESQGGNSDSVSYAIVTVWPGKLPGRRVLVLSGGHTWGTQAAAEYVTEPGYQRQLCQHLAECQRRTGAPAHAEFFQVLLRVEVRDHQPVSMTYVAHHDLQVNDAGSPSTSDRTSMVSSPGLKTPK